MAQIAVKKIRLFITKDSTESLIARLHEEGSVELIEGGVDDTLTRHASESFDHRHWSARLDTAVEFLLPYHKEKDPLRGILEGSRTITTKETLEKLLHSHATEGVLDEVHRLQTRRIEIDAELKALDDEERTIRAWERFNFPLASIADSETTLVFPLHGSQRELDRITEALTAEKEVHLERVSESALLVILHRSARDVVERAIGESEAEILRLPHKNETAAEALSHIVDTKNAHVLERSSIESKAADLSKRELASLKQIADHARWVANERDTATALPQSASVSVFDVWVPAPTWKSLEPKLVALFPTMAFEELALDENETPPTVIENRGLVRPFEFITRLYGVPSHKDLDPTPFLSFFFFMFFGLSLSDFGYGVTLMALTGFALIRYKVPPGMRSLLTTLFFGGFGAAVVGAIYGGYFGVPADVISPLLAALQLFDPIGNPMPVFYLALAIGVVQIMFGIILDIARMAKNNDLINGLLDNVPWLLMFLVLIAFVIAQVDILPEAAASLIKSTWTMFAIGAAILISITKARLGKGIVDMLLKGVLALYGGVNYFSDVLSYSRLLALGLATSALGFSVNLIADIVGGEGLGIGTVFAVLVLLAGHTLNITLSTLGAFIHSSRLQYVEFFGKFLTGTGKPLVPFARDTKYTILIPDAPG